MVSKQNYLQKREEREILKSKAGLVSEKFPGVSTIALNLTYRQRGVGLTLMKRTMHFHGGSPALFKMDCLQDECTNGGFDLTDVVKALVKGKGLNLPDFDGQLPIAGADLPLLVQLRNNQTGICWEGSFATPKKNLADQFSAKQP